jgi:large repetitive protein
VGGSLPGGFSLIANTGSINGKSLTAGTFTFTVQVSDGTNTATRPLSITIKPSLMPIIIDTTSLPSGEVGIAYSRTLSVSGGNGTYNWSISGGSLPGGLNIGADTGLISGTPKTAGLYSFTAQVSDGTATKREQSYNLTILSVPAITSASLPDGVVGTDYDQVLSGSGGTSPYTWSTSSGTVPDGLTLDADYGELYGTPKTAGTFKFTVQLKDTFGGIATKDFSITIKAK